MVCAKKLRRTMFDHDPASFFPFPV